MSSLDYEAIAEECMGRLSKQATFEPGEMKRIRCKDIIYKNKARRDEDGGAKIFDEDAKLWDTALPRQAPEWYAEAQYPWSIANCVCKYLVRGARH